MTGRSPGPWGGKAPAAGEMPGIPDDADGYEDINVLSLAGQIPSDDGEWLLVTSLDSQPGAGFLARHLRPGRVARPRRRRADPAASRCQETGTAGDPR